MTEQQLYKGEDIQRKLRVIELSVSYSNVVDLVDRLSRDFPEIKEMADKSMKRLLSSVRKQLAIKEAELKKEFAKL